jgi:hypothetical protein
LTACSPDLGRRTEAMAEFKKASELDPKGAPAAPPPKKVTQW